MDTPQLVRRIRLALLELLVKGLGEGERHFDQDKTIAELKDGIPDSREEVDAHARAMWWSLYQKDSHDVSYSMEGGNMFVGTPRVVYEAYNEAVAQQEQQDSQQCQRRIQKTNVCLVLASTLIALGSLVVAVLTGFGLRWSRPVGDGSQVKPIPQQRVRAGAGRSDTTTTRPAGLPPARSSAPGEVDP